MEDIRELLGGSRNHGCVEPEEEPAERAYRCSFDEITIHSLLQIYVLEVLCAGEAVGRDALDLPSAHICVDALGLGDNFFTSPFSP